jgi:hypothetical protein
VPSTALARRVRRARPLLLAALAAPAGCAGSGRRPPQAPAASASAAPSAALTPPEPLPPPAPTARTDRWQILLNSGGYLYEVRLVAARGDSLFITQPEGARGVGVDDVDELRLVQAAVRAVGSGPSNTVGNLAGVDDAVYKLSRVEPAERRRIVAELLRVRTAEPR